MMINIILEWAWLLDWWPFLALLGFVWAPKTWTPGELVSAAAMNTNIRDHLNESLRTQITVLTGSQNNFALEGPFAYVKGNNAAPLTITGALIDSGNVDGAKVIIEALNSTVTFKHQNASSTTSNRIITADGNDLVLAAFGRALMVYDGTASRWRVNRASSGLPANLPTHTHASAGQGGTIDHGATTGREDDDHSAYATNEEIKSNSGAILKTTAPQAIANTTVVTVDLDTDEYDPLDWGDLGANTITPDIAGLYAISFYALWADNSNGIRYYEIANAKIFSRLIADTTSNYNGCMIFYLNGSTALTPKVYQDSGGALNLTTFYLSVAKVGATKIT